MNPAFAPGLFRHPPVSDSTASRPHLILFALWLMMFSASSQLIIMVPLLPEIEATLGVNAFWQGMLLTAYALSLGVSALLTGPLSDRIGRRRILLLGTLLLSVTLALHTVAADYELLLGMRLLAGIGGGMLSGGSVAYVGDYFPYERRGWANGWVMTGTAMGQIAGVPIGKVLGASFGYRWPFVLFAITMAGAFVLIWQFVPRPDVDLDPRRLTPRRVVQKYRTVLQGSPVAAAVGAYFLMFAGFGLFASFLPTWLEGVIGLSGYEVALLFAIGGVANVLAAPSAGHLSDGIGRKPLVVGASALLAGLVFIAPYTIAGFWSAAFLFFLAMAGVGIRIGPLQSLLTALVPDSRRGLLMGLAMSIGQAGFGIGSFIASSTYAFYGYASNTLLGTLVTVGMAVLVHRGLPEPHLGTRPSPADAS
jgi:predicted MFS family arabinose efflux permease